MVVTFLAFPDGGRRTTLMTGASYDITTTGLLGGFAHTGVMDMLWFGGF